MSDLIERLISLADCDARSGEPLGKVMREAAAEIIRLRAAGEAALYQLVISNGAYATNARSEMRRRRPLQQRIATSEAIAALKAVLPVPKGETE
jgi:hypothetical protein